MSTSQPPPIQRRALHAIALFEALKGVAAIMASVGLLSLAHHDVRAMAYALIGHFHLDPDAHYPRMVLDEATWLANSHLRVLVLLAWAYASVRFLEAYGLWKDRGWAEWLAALSGAVYLPLEVSHLLQQRTLVNGLVLGVNAAVVVFMVLRLWQRQRRGRLRRGR